MFGAWKTVVDDSRRLGRVFVLLCHRLDKGVLRAAVLHPGSRTSRNQVCSFSGPRKAKMRHSSGLGIFEECFLFDTVQSWCHRI